jgi:hypothetical protein
MDFLLDEALTNPLVQGQTLSSILPVPQAFMSFISLPILDHRFLDNMNQYLLDMQKCIKYYKIGLIMNLKLHDSVPIYEVR